MIEIGHLCTHLLHFSKCTNKCLEVSTELALRRLITFNNLTPVRSLLENHIKKVYWVRDTGRYQCLNPFSTYGVRCIGWTIIRNANVRRL